MIKHYITRYEEDGKLYAESWIQINIFGRCYCISRKRTEIVRENIEELAEIGLKIEFEIK